MTITNIRRAALVLALAALAGNATGQTANDVYTAAKKKPGEPFDAYALVEKPPRPRLA